MPSHAQVRLLSVIALPLSAPLVLAAAGCSGGSHRSGPQPPASWSDGAVNAVSRAAAGSGITAVTALRRDGTLETVVYDLPTGRRLWSRPATMPGRPPDMGVQPPAVAGTAERPVVAAVEPVRGGRSALVVRDARTGARAWRRPVGSSYGPVRCGAYLCLPESTDRPDARLTVLDPATGRPRWRLPGLAEVEWSSGDSAVFLRMTGPPVLESRRLGTGALRWSYPLDRALGGDVSLSGGWAFGSLGNMLVGHVAPYQAEPGGPPSAYGFFGLRPSDGKLVWSRKRMLRVYPSANPAVVLIASRVDAEGGYAGLARLNPRTGRTIARVPARRAPRNGWWPAFPADLSAVGFLSPNRPGSAFDLRRKAAVPADGMRTWSFCTISPGELRITGRSGFYPVAPMCAYDLGTGRRVADPGPPPGWYTGATDGWRIWRDERGGLHALNDAHGTVEGM